VKDYYHDFKICTMFAGLDECMEDVMTRFMKGLNSEIQTIVMHEAYTHISHLFLLACKAENEILLYNYTSTEHVSHSSSFASALHADQEHKIVKPAVVFPSSQEELIADPCDSEDLWDNDSHVLRQQLVNEHVTYVIEPNDLAKLVICIANKTEELKLLSSLNTWGYIEFDDLCELGNLDNILFDRSTMPCPSHAIFYFAGKYNNTRQFLVHRVYISSIYSVSSHCTNNILACSQEVEKLLFPCTLVELSGLFLEDHDKTLVMNINHDAKPRTVCCQEGENDENITCSDMTMSMAPATKVKLFQIVTTFDIFEELILRCKVCILLFVELLTWIKRRVKGTRKALRNKEVDWGPSNDISNIPNQATTSSELTTYLGKEYTLESRTTLLQEGEDDEDIAAIDTTTPMITSPFVANQGPMTRACARKHNYKVNSFLVVGANSSLNVVLKPCYDIIMLRCSLPSIQPHQ
jgi:hypothetical protein